MNSNFIQRTITGLLLGILFYSSFFYLPPFFISALLLGALAYILIAEWPTLFNVCSAPFWLIMPLYPVLPFVLMVMINQESAYRQLLLFLVVLVSAHDTGSYIIGSLWGKHPIAPTISKNKTWEGFMGGYAATCSALSLLLYNQTWTDSMLLLPIFVLITCFLGLCGDLFESWLKRRAHIKDSGTLLPGHGGLLDRFDGIMWVAVFFFCIKKQLIYLLHLA